jgi:hypothetical protein
MSSPTPTAAESFGRTLAAEGTHVFVGAPLGGAGCARPGAVHVFERDTRALVQTIDPPLQPTLFGPAVLAREFGAALAVDGGRLLVGAPGGLGGCGGCGLGEAMLFDAMTGELLHILQPLEPPSSVWFDVGASVAIAGNNVVVGVPHGHTPTPGGPPEFYEGLVLLFDATTGAHLTTLVPDSVLNDGFGRSVAASADRVATSTGKGVHLYNADQSSPQFGQLIATYDAQFYASGGAFGTAIAFVGQYLVVGAPSAFIVQGIQTSGAVFVFDGPTLVRTLLNPVGIADPSLVTGFGASLAPAGDAIVVGAPEANLAFGRGSAYVFRVDDGTLVKTVQAIPSLAGSGFGSSVAAVDDVTIVAAPRAFEGVGFGAAFAFSPTLGFPEPPAFTHIPSKSFSLRDDNQPPVDLGRRSIRFKSLTAAAALANRIVPPDRDSGGDPTIHGAVLTVYNAAGLTLDAVTVPLPATGPTAGEGWARLGPSSAPAGYGYRNRSPNGPISRILVKRDRIIVRGGKDGWGYSLDEAAQGSIAVRLQVGDAPPWCAVIPASASRVDRVDLFVGQRDAPAPAACPPLP